jgi:hypothetical protein
MDVEYTGTVRDDISRILGGVDELEEVIRQQCRQQPVSRVTIAPLIPGRSGAVVFLVRRLDSHGPRKPWVVKASSDVSQVNQERRNYANYIQDRWQQVPSLLDTGASRLLIYEFGGFLAGFDPITLRQGYRQSSPEALAVLMQRLVKVLFDVHEFGSDTISFLQREQLHTPPHEFLPTLSTLTPSLATEVADRWQEVVTRAAQLPTQISRGCHSDLNAGNILFEPGDHASYPLFIDFGIMEEGSSLGYPGNGYPPFWDYAKLERDIKTRLFVEEATSAGLDVEAMLSVIRHVDPPHPDGPLPPALASLPCVQRLATTLQSLREAVQRCSPPDLFERCYRLSVAYSTVRVLYRPADDDLDPIAQHQVAAESVLALLRPASGSPAATGSRSVSEPAIVLVRSFASTAPLDPALLLDLTDLFHDRLPLRDQVWGQDIPQRIGACLPAITRMAQPVQIAFACHLSIAWALGTQLNPKRGMAVTPLQIGPEGFELWDGTSARLPDGAPGWQQRERDLQRGNELAVVLSLSRPALADADRAIEELRLPIGHRLHLELPEPGINAIHDGSHARWLVDALIRAVLPLAQKHRPPRLHLFAACPAAFAFLLGQQADALGPTTVYEFAFNHPSRSYSAGMKT